MANCQRCKSERVVAVNSHASDRHSWRVGSKFDSGYLPYDLGVGGGDDLNIEFCMDCGQLQGIFPLPPSELEMEKE